MGTLRFGLRAFCVGLVVGLLFAPRPGVETRRILRERLGRFVDPLAELLALPETPVESGTPRAPVGRRAP